MTAAGSSDRLLGFSEAVFIAMLTAFGYGAAFMFFKLHFAHISTYVENLFESPLRT
jgi:hypothetical protein